jgi:hypothetical protein
MAQPIDIKAGFLPYSDGSGHQVEVRIEQECDGSDVTLAVNTSYRFLAAEWPRVREGIDRLLQPHTSAPVLAIPGHGPGSNTGHGYVWERPDGMKARCGGPGLCKECAGDAARLKARQPTSEGHCR